MRSPLSSSFGSISLLLGLTLLCRVSRASSPGELARTPPRGWNSYDSYSWIISEEDFLANSEIVSKRLLQYGYEYVVVDFLWYRRLASGSYTDAYGFDSIDEWGRVVPDPERWPSSRGGKGFTEVARKVHDMGLKFGIHAMRGISAQAVNSNTPILDVTTGTAYSEDNRPWGAKDVGMRERACAWMTHGFMSVDTQTRAGRAFLRSLYRQYADWGVDFVKLDCVFGEDFDEAEIKTVSEILAELERPMVFSLSPGKYAMPSMAENIKDLVNMYRITADDWDIWSQVEEHFDAARDFAASQLIGAAGFHGRSWPDLDMLPLGSPLMFGGDLKRIDDITFDLITNPALLEINAFSVKNMEMWVLNGNGTLKSSYSGLCASVNAEKGEIYFAIFNLNPTSSSASVRIEDLAMAVDFGPLIGRSCNATEAWSGMILSQLSDSLSADVNGHGCALFIISCV
ncbi:unnamed protein product [Spirodela intermedia]|uniref:Uncharacterized protein n=1 Tax=Spirodela intermedia TaxID=51605 RepID=A0A7I8L514_SPIIN|nr:unnamed protein product [Spirodela intermedia]